MKEVAPTIQTRMLSPGWVMVSLCVGLALMGGITLGIGMLVILAVFFTGVMLFCLFWGRANLQELELQTRLQGRIVAEKSYEMSLYLDNKKERLSSYSLEVALDLIHGQNLHGRLPWVGRGEGARLKTRVAIPHRGVTSALCYRIRSTFPLGVFSHERKGEVQHDLLVYPRLIMPGELLSYGSVDADNPMRNTVKGDTMGDLRGVRQWQPGDPAKKIHWAASAKSLSRGLGLRVVELDPPGYAPESCVVLFHSYAQRGQIYRTDRFERACSLTAGVLSYLHARNQQPVFIADFLDWQEVACVNRKTYMNLLATLSRAERKPGTGVERLQSTIDQVTADQVIIVSDVSPDYWADQLTLPENALIIDIRQAQFRRKKGRKGGAL